MSVRSSASAPFHVPAARVGGGGSGPPDLAPSLGWGGFNTQDPRLPFNVANSATGAGIVGFHGSGLIRVLAQVPSTLAINNIALAQGVTNGVPMTLTAGAGVSVLAAPFICLPSLNVIPAGALVLDGLPGYVTFGTQPSSFRSLFYNPGTMLARAPSVTSSVSATGGSITLFGWDVYGYPTSQTLTAVTNATNAAAKAIKFVGSAVPQFTDAGNTYSIGTADKFGAPLFMNTQQDTIVNWNNAAIFTSFRAGNNVPPGLTGFDVRGTVSPGTASNGVKLLQIWQAVAIEAMAVSGTFPGNLTNAMFGFPQT